MTLPLESNPAADAATSSALSLHSGPRIDEAPVDGNRESTEVIAANGSFPPGFVDLVEAGRGGMGVVYQARQLPLGRMVAVKMLTHFSADTVARERFRLEASTLARLRHPNLTTIYEYGEHQGNPYLVLEFVEGGSLQQKLRAGPFTPRAAAELIECVARVVDYIHTHGIIHRDLKPGNILLTLDGVPRLADFGLARLIGSGSDLTNTNVCLGTPDYMAPEQTYPNQILATTVDVYALGAILYELLIGRPPFRNDKPFDTFTQVRIIDPTPPRRLNPAVPVDLQTICLKCLEKDPARRYPSALALAEDLQRWLHDEPIQARPVSKLGYLRRWCRRNPAIAVMSGALVVLAVGALIGLSGLVLKLQRANTQLQQAVQREETAHAETERARNRARQVIEDLPIGQMAQAFAQQRQFSEPQERFLDQVIDYYRELCLEAPATLDERRRQHRVYTRLADFLRQLSRFSEALPAAQQALELARQINAEPGRTVADTAHLADSRGQLRGLLANLGRFADAEQEGRAELAIREKLVQQDPTRKDLKYGLAQAYLHLSPALAELKRLDEAMQTLEAAVSMLEELAVDDSNNRVVRQDLAGAYFNRGVFLRKARKEAEANAQFAAAAREFDSLIRSGPPNLIQEESLAKSLNSLAQTFITLQQFREAEDAQLRALRIQATMAGRYPQMTRFGIQHGVMLISLGHLRMQSRRFKEALEAFQHATTILEKFHQQAPTDDFVRGNLCGAWVSRGQALEAMDQPADATAAWEQALQLEQPPSPTLRAHYVLNLLLCQRLQDAEQRLDHLTERATVPRSLLQAIAAACARTAQQTPEQAEAWSKRALTLLDLLEKRGYYKDPKHVETLRTADDFAQLRQRPEFQQLLTRIESSSK